MRVLTISDGLEASAAPTGSLEEAGAIPSYASEADWVVDNGTPFLGAIFWDTALSLVKVYDGASWIAGVTGSGIQTLTNKKLQGGTASANNMWVIPSNTKANLDALTRAEGAFYYATDEDVVYADDGASLVPVGGSWSTFNTEAISNGASFSSSISTRLQFRRVQGTGGAITASVTPFGSTGGWADGLLIRLVGQDDANAVKIVHNDAAKGALLNGDCILGKGCVLELQWDNTAQRWIETFRNT